MANYPIKFVDGVTITSGFLNEFQDGAGSTTNTVATLRSVDHTILTKVFVFGRAAKGDGLGGWYYYDSTDTTSADNGTTVIVDSTGGRWKFTGQVVINTAVVNSIVALKAIDKTQVSYCTTKGYYAAGDGGAGEYWYDSTDTTSTDNGGSVIVATDGARWKLIHSSRIHVKQFGARGSGAGDSYAAITAALTYAATVSGLGLIIDLGGDYYSYSQTLAIPSCISLVGEGKRSAILNYTGTSSAISLTSVTYSKLKGFRIGLPNSASAVGINIVSSASGDTRWCTIEDVEIAGPSLISGQIGFNAAVGGGQFITDNKFDFSIFQVDKPVQLSGTEGNVYNISINGWGTSATPIGINTTTFAEIMDMRIAGAPVTGFKAYTNGGANNLVRLVVDCGSSGTAIDISGINNVVQLTRPENLTPIGTFSATNTVIDSQSGTVQRLRAGGTTLTTGNFSISTGWGSTRSVDTISGSDNRFKFRVNSAGTGQAANPTITITFAEGAFAVAPFAIVVRNGGNQITTPFIWSESTTALTITFVGTPVAGEQYLFEVHLIG